MKSSIKLLLLSILSLVVMSCQREDESGTSDSVRDLNQPYEKIDLQACLMRVGSHALTKRMVEKEIDMQIQLYNKKTRSAEKRERFAKDRVARARMIIQRFDAKALLLDLVQKSGFKPTAVERQALEKKYLKKFGARGETFDQLCRSLGEAETCFRDRFEFDLLTEGYIGSVHSNEWRMTEADIDAAQARYQKLSAIGAATNQLVRAHAAEVAKMAKRGDDFAKLADRYSEDETKEPGGVLGACSVESFHKLEANEIWSRVVVLKEQEVSDVVETDFSFYIFKRVSQSEDEPEPIKGEICLAEIYFRKAQVFPDYSRDELRQMGEKERYEKVVTRLIKEHRASVVVESPQMKVLFPAPRQLRRIK